MKCGYVASLGAAASCTTGAKTLLAVRGNAAFGVDLKKIRIGFDGITAAVAPVLVELVYITFATNAPGTNSTSVTPLQQYGRVATHGFTAGKLWTSEPTVVTILDEWYITPNGGFFPYDFPLGDTPDSAFSEGLGLRVNPAATVNARAALLFERA